MSGNVTPERLRRYGPQAFASDTLAERLARVIVVDFEACDGHRKAWPIEFGVARIRADLSISRGGHLIRPHASWDQSLWNDYAERKIHRIPRAALEDGMEAVEAGRLLAHCLSVPDLIAVSDAPASDQAWLDQLVVLGGGQAGDIRLFKPTHVLQGLTDEAGLARLNESLKAEAPEHRGPSDAARLCRALISVLPPERGTPAPLEGPECD